jgi:hypothetical protein
MIELTLQAPGSEIRVTAKSGQVPLKGRGEEASSIGAHASQINPQTYRFVFVTAAYRC